MTSIASWGNPLVGADQYATLTHSIYTDLSRSFSAVEKSATRLISEQGENEVAFDEASPNVLLFKQGDIPRVAISFNSGALLTESSLLAEHVYSTGFNEHTAADNELATKYYVDSVSGENVSEDEFVELSTRVLNIEQNYLSKIDTAANTEKMEWTYNGNTYSLMPYFQDILLGQFDGIQNVGMRLSPTGIMNIQRLRPVASIDFGYDITGVATVNMWQATISHVANSQWYNNQDSSPYNTFSKDNIVPTYKVLEDNFAKKSEIVIPDAKSFVHEFTNDGDVVCKSRFGYLDDNKAVISYKTKIGNNAERLNCVIDAGTMRTTALAPSTFIMFGLNVNGTESSTQWPAYIMNVANDTWFQNRGTDIYSENNLDQLVPSFKVLEDNFVSKTTINSIVNNANKSTADSATAATKDTYVPSYRVLQDNYYTKTDADARFINVDEPVVLIKKSEEIDTFIPTATYTATTADSGGINLCEQMIIESDEISFTATIQVQVSEGYDVSLLNIGMRVNNEYKYLDSEENGTFSGTLTFSNLTPGTTYTIMYGWKTTSGSVKFKITSATLSYSLNTSLGNYYSKKEVENLKKWTWANSSNTWTFEPQRNSGINGAYQNSLKMTEDGTTVIRMVPSGIYAETFSPESMIQFGKTITGGNVSGRWRSSIVGVANDNYNPTTYSTVDTDTIVPSLKYLNSNYYPKSYVDALEARVAALENALGGQ